MNRVQTVLTLRSALPRARKAAFAVVLGILATSAAVRAQTTEPAPSPAASGNSSFATKGVDPFSLGETVFFGGLSLGTFGIYGSTTVPPLNAGLDYAFHKYITAGGIFAYSRYDYLSESLTYLTFAARGTFHPTFWFERMKIPLDPYGVATLGYTQAVWSGDGDYNYSYLVIGPSVGARYWFMPNLAGQAEAGVGNGLSLASIGLSYKF